MFNYNLIIVLPLPPLVSGTSGRSSLSVDKIFVINLDNRTDRWGQCLKEFKKHDITNYERVSAETYDPDYIAMYQFLQKIRMRGHKYNCGSIGCKKSHIKILKLALERNYKSILILEDDFEITIIDYVSPTFKWDMMYLSSNHKSPCKKVDNNFSIASKCYSTCLLYTSPSPRDRG